MTVTTPTTPYNDLEVDTRADKAYLLVKSMTEDQLRYAMWCTLVLLFGHPASNAPEIVATTQMPNNQAMAEAHLILAEIGISKSLPLDVERIRRSVEIISNSIRRS